MSVKITDVLENKIDIEPVNSEVYSAVKLNWDRVAKPLDSLGTFEVVHSSIGAILGRTEKIIDKCEILVFCADNGIVEEGISQSGQEITAICADSISRGNSVLGAITRSAGADIKAIDVGMNTDEIFEFVENKKTAHGTKNFLKEPAMTNDEMLMAIQTGMDAVAKAKAAGYTLIGIGEMGIGNTTTTSAIASALLNLEPAIVTGRGAGLSDDGLKRKISVIEKAIKKYELKSDEPLKVLSTVGGFDIAAMVGACIGGAYYHIPIVLDGLISTSAALCATRICPMVKQFLIASHEGKDQAAVLMIKELDLKPVINAKMALGEGTGAALMMNLLRVADSIYEESISFEKVKIEQYERL